MEIWHPFTQMQTALPPLSIVRGEGTYLYTADGQAILDGISSWWVNLHGHTHPYIVNKLMEQALQLEHVIFADFTHPPACELAHRLLPLLPGTMGKVFFSDNGSTAVETALKMALQYWHNQGIKKRTIISLNHGYHGDTFGAMAAAGKTSFNRPFWPYLFEVERIDPDPAQLKPLLERGDVACLIVEPQIQGAGGMRIYSKERLASMLELCHAYDVLTIVDEVMTGFGRTGSLFASEGLSPDIICLSKGLTGGFLPMGLTACTDVIYNQFLSDEPSHALLHGHSYTANPLACAVALASLDLLLLEQDGRPQIAKSHEAFCAKWRGAPLLKRCESLGTILIWEFETHECSYFSPIRDQLYQFYLAHNVLLRPLGNVVYVMPPYCTTPEQLTTIYTTLERSYAIVENNHRLRPLTC